MKRRVVILRDAGSPLHYLRCEKPCAPEGWCMTLDDKPGCYLGGALCEAGARTIGDRAGYEVVGK